MTIGSPRLPLLHHALRIPPWRLRDAGVCHTSFLSFLSGMKAHMWPDVQCLETILLHVIFCFIAKDQSGPCSFIRVRRGSQRWFLNVSMVAPFSSPQNFVRITLLSFNNECCHTRVWGQLYFFSLITTVLFWWHSCKSLYSWNAVAWPEYILYWLLCISFCFFFWDCIFNISFGSLQIQVFFFLLLYPISVFIEILPWGTPVSNALGYLWPPRPPSLLIALVSLSSSPGLTVTFFCEANSSFNQVLV